jgi:CrcB protein
MHRIVTYVFIAVGGAAGAGVRWAVHESLGSDGFPWTTLLVNVVGAGLLAFVANHRFHPSTVAVLGLGFCGGLTTLSTLSVEVVQLADDDRAALGLVYVLSSVILGVAAFVTVRKITLDQLGET